LQSALGRRRASIVDQIFITRDPHDKQAMMTYIGKLRGNRVIGTYAGGAWTAIVLR
jgi:hypothetical protein